MRLGGKDVMLTALFVGGGNGFELLFDLDLTSGGGSSEAQDRALGAERQAGAKQKTEQCEPDNFLRPVRHFSAYSLIASAPGISKPRVRRKHRQRTLEPIAVVGIHGLRSPRQRSYFAW
jgi:hypothetical protein